MKQGSLSELRNGKNSSMDFGNPDDVNVRRNGRPMTSEESSVLNRPEKLIIPSEHTPDEEVDGGVNHQINSRVRSFYLILFF